MERPLRIIASSLLLLCGPLQARSESPAPDAAPSAEELLCEAAANGTLTLHETQLTRCRQLWRQRVDAARARSQDYLERMIEEGRLRREFEASLPPPRPPVTVDTFLRGDLAYGDVVVTDKGPRVFIGKPGEAATAEDFVALDSARSPHRGRAKAYGGAYPQPQSQAATPRPAAPIQQERKP